MRFFLPPWIYDVEKERGGDAADNLPPSILAKTSIPPSFHMWREEIYVEPPQKNKFPLMIEHGSGEWLVVDWAANLSASTTDRDRIRVLSICIWSRICQLRSSLLPVTWQFPLHLCISSKSVLLNFLLCYYMQKTHVLYSTDAFPNIINPQSSCSLASFPFSSSSSAPGHQRQKKKKKNPSSSISSSSSTSQLPSPRISNIGTWGKREKPIPPRFPLRNIWALRGRSRRSSVSICPLLSNLRRAW